MSRINLTEVAAPSTPASGKLSVYAKTDGLLYCKNDGGTEYDLTAGAGGGETNTASSAGTGVSLYYTKTASDLEFNAIKSENALLTVALDGVTHDVELTVNEGTIDHDNLASVVANEHIDHSAVSITAGTGLTGGGTLESTRTIDLSEVDANSVTLKLERGASLGAAPSYSTFKVLTGPPDQLYVSMQKTGATWDWIGPIVVAP